MSGSLILHPEDVLTAANYLSREELGLLFLALCSSSCGKELPELSPAAGIAFNLIKNGVQYDRKAGEKLPDETSTSRKKPKETEPKTGKKAAGDAEALFARLWEQYPNKKGRGKISDAKKRTLLEIGEEHMIRAIHRYIDEHHDKEKHGEFVPNWQNGSTFFNSGYIDYLDENYAVAPREPKSPGSQQSAFFCYEQSSTDWDEFFFQAVLMQEKEATAQEVNRISRAKHPVS